MMLFRANYKDPADNKTYSVPVIAVDLQIEKALILHGKRDLIKVDFSELTWASYD